MYWTSQIPPWGIFGDDAMANGVPPLDIRSNRPICCKNPRDVEEFLFYLKQWWCELKLRINQHFTLVKNSLNSKRCWGVDYSLVFVDYSLALLICPLISFIVCATLFLSHTIIFFKSSFEIVILLDVYYHEDLKIL